MNSMNIRRTVRAYSDQPLSGTLLHDLMTTACRSSNTGNMQAYSVVITRDPEQKKRLAPAHFNQKQALDAPVVLTFCADLNRLSRWCIERKAEPGFGNVQALTYAAIDATILAQTFCVAAEEAGLGVCYLGTTTYNAETIIDVLELPTLVLPIVTLTVGYPKFVSEEPLSDRLPLDGILHNEKYSEYTSKDIDAIYTEKEDLPESAKFVEINQKETLAQVYAEIRYKKSDNEFFSEAWIQALRRQGFLN
jgi:FMN reductase (NADPH)